MKSVRYESKTYDGYIHPTTHPEMEECRGHLKKIPFCTNLIYQKFQNESKKSGLTGVIIVEASHLLKDNKWVLKLVNGNDFFCRFSRKRKSL